MTTPPPQTPDLPTYNLKRLLGSVLLSAVVLVIIGYVTYVPGTYDRIVAVLNPWLLFAAGLFLVLRILASAYRLHYISHYSLGFRHALRGQFMWDFSSNITPSVIGGGPFAALLIARDTGKSVGAITAVMLFAMLMDQIWFSFVIPILVAASIWVDVYPDTMGDIGAGLFIAYFLGMLVWVSLFAYSTLLRPEWLQAIVGRLFNLRWLRRFKDRVERETETWGEQAAVLRSQPFSFYLIGFLLAAVTWMSRYMMLVCIVWSIHAALPVMQFFFRTVAMLLGALVMPTPGGAGGVEGMYALFLAPLIPDGMVAPTLLIWRLFAYYFFIAIGLVMASQIVKKSLTNRIDESASAG